jgi:hypothetical protein
MFQNKFTNYSLTSVYKNSSMKILLIQPPKYQKIYALSPSIIIIISPYVQNATHTTHSYITSHNSDISLASAPLILKHANRRTEWPVSRPCLFTHTTGLDTSKKRQITFVSAGNQTLIPGLSNLYPSHYTDPVFPASQVHPVTFETCVNGTGSQDRRGID